MYRARNKFPELKKSFLNPKFNEQIKEFEKALETLLQEYDTADWENRFVVGGVLEILFCALLNSMGFNAKLVKGKRYDLIIDEISFSLKSNFIGSGDIRLINILGNKKAYWKEPTIFFISNIGICYGDYKLGLKTKSTKDALTINIKEIKNLIKKDEKWHIPFSVIRKPKKPKNQRKTASYDVAKSILESIESKYLINFIPKSSPK